MGLKVEGSVSNIRREETTIKKAEIKANFVQREVSTSNNSVRVKQNEVNFRANYLQRSLNQPTGNTVAAGSTPTLTEEEAERRADEIIDQNGGRDNLNTEGVAEDLAEIAKQNPADAWMITQAMLGDRIDQDGEGKIEEKDKDEIAQSFVENLNDAEIADMAADESGRNLLDRMQHHLLSGDVHGDEVETADRIQAELGKYRTFSDWYDGIDPNSEIGQSVNYGMAMDPNASPEEAAAALKSDDRAYYDQGDDVHAFVTQLEAHKDDPEWIQRYYAALGSDKAAELIGNAATPTAVSNPLTGIEHNEETADRYFENLATIRQSLETLRQNGGLSQTDMNNLVNSMEDGNFNPNVATDIFGTASPELQELYVRATVANGDDTVEASGSYVLAQMSSSRQSQILGDLAADGKLDSFIEGAMAGQTDVLDMRSYLTTGFGDRYTTLGGVEELLETANSSSYIPYPPYYSEPFSQDLQNRLFGAVTKGLNNSKAFENFVDDPSFKDQLSRLFMRNTTEILNSQTADGAFFDGKFVEGMTKFFELTLFSANGGELRDDLMSTIVTTMSNTGDAAKEPALSQRDYERTHNGWSQQDHVEIMGGMLGMVWQAAENQKEYIQNEIMQDQNRKKELVGLFVGMAFSFVPGADDVIGKLAEEGASYLQQLPDKIIDFTWSQTQDQLEDGAQDFMLGLLKDTSNVNALANVDELIDRFREVIVATNAALPNGETRDDQPDELDLRSAFRSAFSFYRDLVDLD